MSVPFLDLRIADDKLRQEIESVFRRLVETSSFIGGPEVQLFGDEFAAYCGAARCAPVANGTDALVLALKALGVGPGDEVITVPFTFIASAEAITLAGASVKFVDIHPKSYTMDHHALERAITPKTKAIIPVHLFGQAADMDPIMDIARRRNLKVVEDACQSHGAEYKGKRTGVLGDAACFSFYPTKNLGGFGDGGAVTSNSPELIDRILQIANHGQGAKRYYHPIEGTNSRLDTIQAAVLRLKLRGLDAANESRRRIATEYARALAKNSFITPPFIEPFAKHVFHLYCVETSFRDELIRHLSDRQIGHGVYYALPLHLQPAYAHLRYERGAFPVTERLSERILSLPMYPEMTGAQVAAVCDAIAAFSPRVPAR